MELSEILDPLHRCVEQWKFPDPNDSHLSELLKQVLSLYTSQLYFAKACFLLGLTSAAKFGGRSAVAGSVHVEESRRDQE